MDGCLSVVTMSNIHCAERGVTQAAQFPPGAEDLLLSLHGAEMGAARSTRHA